MADPQPQSNDQGFLPGLLGKVRDFFPDPAAAYGGLLSDEATRRAFAWRELGAAAGAFSQGAMPVPYKGGIPFGATLGAAGAAASTAGDSLIQARLQQAQSEQAVQNAAALHAKQLVTTEILRNYQDPNSIYNRGGGTGTGTGTDGKKLTGPAAIIAGGGGSTVGGIGGPDNAEIRTNNFAGMRVPGAAAGGPNTNPAGWQTFATPADGVQAIGNQLDRYAAGKTTGQPLTTLRQMVSTWAPPSENDTDALIKRASTVTGLDPDAPVDLSNPAVRAKVTEAFIRNEQGGNLHPKAVDGLSAVYGNAWSPHGGQAQTAAAPAPAAEPPMAPSAAPPGGLLIPDPTSAAPPQLATPPAAGAPGPAAGAASPTLGLLAAQQGGGDVGSPLGAASPQIASVPSRGLLAQVAGPGAAEPSAPPAAVTQQAGPPHTGAAGAAELAGLLAQQPASAAPPTATPYTNAPPANGQGAPAPGPAPGPAPPAPPLAPGGAAPPMPQPVTPSAIPGAPSAQDVRDANRAVILHGIAGIPLPPNITEIAKFPMVGPTAQATAAGTAAGQQPYQLQQAANKAMWDIYVAQQKPREPQREGSFTFNPQTGQYTLNRSMIEADGSTHQHISILDQNLKPLSDYDAGPIKASPGAVAAGTAAGTEAGRHAPTGVPGSPLIGTSNFTPSPNAPDPTKPIQTARGTVMPGTDRQTLPSNYVDYDKVQDHWNEWNHDLVTAQTLAGTAEAQINMIIQAAKQNETGGGTEARAALGNFLIGNHIVNQDWVNKNITNVGAVQTMLYAQARDTLTTLAAVNKRFTGGEFKITSQSGASPEQLNSANLPILAQDLAKVRQIQGVAENWAQAQRTQYADGSTWRNPLSFVSNWYTMNPLGKLQEQTMQQIGPLAGQTTVPGVPEGATPTGKTIAGWPEYNLPGRTGTYTFPGQWKDR